MNSCKYCHNDFFLEATPSEKASLGLHKISFGITFKPSNALRNKYFSHRSVLAIRSSLAIEK